MLYVCFHLPLFVLQLLVLSSFSCSLNSFTHTHVDHQVGEKRNLVNKLVARLCRAFLMVKESDSQTPRLSGEGLCVSDLVSFFRPHQSLYSFLSLGCSVIVCGFIRLAVDLCLLPSVFLSVCLCLSLCVLIYLWLQRPLPLSDTRRSCDGPTPSTTPT